MTRFRAVLLSCILSATAVSGAWAQPAPFDMSPERPGSPPSSEIPAPAPAPVSPDAAPKPPEATPAAPASAAVRRYLLQTARLRLQGETASDGWTFHLTPEQAASEASFDLAYSNAVVIAPEVSRLTVSINGTPVVDHAIRSPDGEQKLTVKVAPGVLLPGLNRIRIQAEQRHRTDCTLDSTYALWTDIEAASTFLTFNSPAAARMTRLEDVQALGVDATGRSRFHIVAPALGQSDATATLLRLSQGLSLLGGGVNASFSFSRELPAKTEPGEMIVLAATTAELADIAGAAGLPQPGGSLAGFVTLPGRAEQSTLAFVGDDWKGIDSLVGSFTALSGHRGEAGGMLPTQGWRSSDTPLIDGARRLSFSALGVAAQEFSGRRFATGFTVAMPADFYANAYGTATILLDAAYSSKVIPGSRFIVTVNGQLATTVPITAGGGAVLRHFPVRVSMRHFRPGINTIALEAMLTTEGDATRAPGSTADRTPRFALFDTSELVIPEFARLSRAPDLAATAGLGVPYGGSAAPVAIWLGQRDEATLALAATALGKLSQAAGSAFAVELANDPSQMRGRDGLYAGAAADLPAEALTGVNLAADDAPVSADGGGLNAEAWKDKIDSGTVVGLFSDLNGWMRETFNLDLTAVNLLPQSDTPYTLPARSGFFVSQSADADTNTVMTTVSIADRALLEEAAADLAQRVNWQALQGRLSFRDGVSDEVVAIAPEAPHVVSFEPFTLTNLRLVAANWLSSNFIAYAFLLALAGVLLGLSTHALLSRLGRESD